MDVIRARTLSVFRRLTDDKDPNRTDGERKGRILLFLYETGLIRNPKKAEQGQEATVPKQFQAPLSLERADLSGSDISYVYLDGANLSGANLSDVDLSNAILSDVDLVCTNLTRAKLRDTLLFDANLSNANLGYADLSGASFSRANLSRAILIAANLSRADFRDADLRDADLRDADLRDADLRDADLSGVKLSDAILLRVDLSSVRPGTLTQEQLEGEKPPLLCYVKLPHDIKVDPQRLTSDRKILPEALLERYPEQFKSLEEAQAHVNKLLKP